MRSHPRAGLPYRAPVSGSPAYPSCRLDRDGSRGRVRCHLALPSQQARWALARCTTHCAVIHDSARCMWRSAAYLQESSSSLALNAVQIGFAEGQICALLTRSLLGFAALHWSLAQPFSGVRWFSSRKGRVFAYCDSYVPRRFFH
ncbi:hypothetical protein K466DRAFT_346057 [Polyporus arcularius HHB13444]|uniref:Uncharacterized protein n=1 Tax=Polyporus arcularius HHB13444 TaxID=1314778 RepID=A0A5C3PYA3_9APHY|nr:hypothetical protein K466DRAFT_346057 [Polyporus arcularius HHB13444]